MINERQQTEANALRPHLSPDESIPLPWLAAVFLRERWTVVKFCLAGLILTIGGILLQSPQYVSSFSFIPQAAQDQTKNGLASLAGQFGIALGGMAGGGQSPQLYVDIVDSRDVLTPIIADSVSVDGAGSRRISVAEFLRVSGSNPAAVREKTLDVLRTRVITTVVATRTSGTVTVSVKTRSAEASFQIAERLLNGLNQFNRSTRQTQASEERRFVEGRLKDARTDLRGAEDRLQQFLQANRIVNSPELKFEQERLNRELTLQQQVVGELATQYEDARIREVRDTPMISVIDHPALPVIPAPAHRLRLLFLGIFGAAVAGVALVLARAGWQRQRQTSNDPSYAMLAEEWRSVRNEFHLR